MVGRSRVVVASGALLVAVAVGFAASWAPSDSAPQAEADVADIASAPQVEFDPATATVDSRDEFSTTRVDANGVFQVELSAVPVNVWSGEAWVPASPTLAGDGASGLVAPSHPLSLRLAPVADDDVLLEVERGGYRVSFSLADVASSPVRHVAGGAEDVGGDRAVYEDVFAGTDLVYDVSVSAVKESLVLESAPTVDEVAYTWTVEAPGLEPVRNDFGSLEFRASDGEVVFTMPIPGMWDSSDIPDVRGPAEINVPYQVTPLSEGSFTVTLRPDVEWLKDPARVYPVYVDPAIQPGPDLVWAYKSDGYTSSGYVRVGNSAQYANCCRWRTVAHYNYSSLLSKQITGATLYSTKTSGTANCYGGYVYNATGWGYWNAGANLAPFPNCTSGAASGTIYQQIAAWVATGSGQGALFMTGTECNCYSYKRLSTSLYISYVERPTVTGVTGQTPVDGQTGVALPVMEATGTSYAGSQQFFKYAFTSDDGGVAWTSPWAVSGPFHVPDGALTPGKHYTYSIQTKNDYPVSPEPTFTNAAWHFTMDTAPDEPTGITVDGQPLTTDLTVSEARPEVCATVSDPDGGDVQAMFTLRQAGITVVDSLPGAQVAVTPTTSGLSCATIPYPLSPAGGFTVSAQAFDGHMSSTVFSPAWTVTGPETAYREIPGDHDGETGAVS